MAAFQEELSARRRADAPAAEPVPGFNAAVQEMVDLSDHVIFLSDRERQRLARLGARPRAGTVVRNPVDAGLFGTATPDLFQQATGLKDFVLCVARIEGRKNQALLAHALRGTGLPLVLIGHVANAAYREILERHRTPDLHILDRLPPNSPMLASAFAAARVVVLPSWAEGAPLAALEAGASGASLVLSDESGESEYFGEWARYCDPGDPASMRRAILEAFETRRDAAAVEAQKAFVAETYSWDRHRRATEDVYAEALACASGRAASSPPPKASAPGGAEAPPVTIVFDVTTSANHSGRWTGIARVEAALALALRTNPRVRIRYVAWNNKAREFVEVPFQGIRAGKLARFLAHHDTNPVPLLSLPEGAHYIVPGSAWMQNQLYAENVVSFARMHRLRLTPIIHDIIPTKFPFWFNDGYAPIFEQNLTMLLGGAEHVIAISEATRRDVEAYAARTQGLFIPPVSIFREGDEIRQLDQVGGSPALAQIARDLEGRPFVLTVGAIHLRKNHKLLYDVWLKLAERMGGRCPRLVIVGGTAWNGQEVARALRGDPRLRGLVSILDNVDDEALDWLYRNCLFTAYPSLYEGWGLPVSESLRYGKLCVATNASSVPEIAPGLIELLDPLDTMAWATRIQFYAGSRSALAAAEARIAAEYRGWTWEASAAQLLEVLTAAEAQPTVSRPYTLGQVVPFSDKVAAGRVRGTGWHSFESWGCWSRSTRASLVFNPAIKVEEPLVLVAQLRALPFPDRPLELRVRANGMPVSDWKLRSSGMQVLHAVIPADIAAGAPAVTIEFESAFLTPVRQVTKSDDPRMVGVGLGKVALAPLSAVQSASGYFGEALPEAQRVELGRCHHLLRDAGSRAFLDGKWVAHAGWGMCNTDGRPRLELLLQDLPGRSLDVTLRIRPVATASAPLMLLALANGAEVGCWTFDRPEPVDIEFTLPAEIRARSEPVLLDLVATEAHAPKALGLSMAEEEFGFGILTLEVRPSGSPRMRPRIAAEMGRRLRLGAEADGATALATRLGGDWHGPERRATWSCGPRAVLPLQLPSRPDHGVLVTAEVEIFGPSSATLPTALEVLAGDEPCTRILLMPRRMRRVEIPVPPDRIGPLGQIDLTFQVEAAPSPLMVGEGKDERALGVRIGEFEMAPLPLLSRGQVAVFRSTAPDGVSPDALRLLRGEWFEPERFGCWSRGEAGGLSFAVAPLAASGWRLFLLCTAFGGTAEAPTIVDVEMNGQVVDRLVFTDQRPAVTEVRHMAERADGAGMVHLFFRRRDPVSPHDAGRGTDRRLLGLQLSAAVILGPKGDAAQAREAFAAARLGKLRILGEPGPQDARRERDVAAEAHEPAA